MPRADLKDEEHAAAAHEPKKRLTRTGSHRAIDKFVGARLRDRRLMLGLSQRDLANRVGGASQQMIYKYEIGIASVSAALLYEIAGALGISVDYFFDGFGATEVGQMSNLLSKLMRNIGEIESEEHLEAISHLVRVLAGRSKADGS
jgi:transcriptional regulator with XRE-family HTH domain